jgi:hypothetical protein
MTENHLVIKSVRKESSLLRYELRTKKDVCLFNDVEDFLLHRQGSVSCLVDKLINKDFVLARYTDPTYPV